MIVYYLIFLLSSVCIYNGEKKSDDSKMGKLLCMSAVLIPALLAGMRAESVGTDTGGYVKAIHQLCRKNIDWKMIVGSYQCEIGYYFINYLVTRVSDSFQLLLFVIQILILTPVLLACKDNHDLAEAHLSYLFFLILFFNRSLNTCRQSLAIAFCVYSVKYIRQEKFVKFLLCIFIAASMHKIAFIFGAMYVISHYLKKREGMLYKIGFLAIVCSLIVFYKVILNKLIAMGYLDVRYSYYVNSGNQNISTIEFTTKSIFLVIVLCVAHILKKRNLFNDTLVFYVVLDYLIYCVGFYANYAQRISYYIGFFVIFVLPQIPGCVNKRQKNICTLILLAIALAFSYMYYGVSGCDGTVPYILSKSM